MNEEDLLTLGKVLLRFIQDEDEYNDMQGNSLVLDGRVHVEDNERVVVERLRWHYDDREAQS